MDISALLGPGILDPIALGERVFQELQDRLPSNSKLADISDKTPEELVAATIADWLAKMMINDDSPGMAHWSTIGNPHEDQMYKELYDRNIVLAAALGACGNCWGGNVDCPICDGAGAPGWVLPDEQLYVGYVDPAVRAVTNTHGSVYARAQEQELSTGGNMPTTPPTGTDTDTANALEGEDPMEYYADEMSGDAGTSGLESSEAKQAKAQAIALSQAAEAAKARYARLASPEAGPGSWDLQYGPRTGGTRDPVAAQAGRIGGMEAALAATTVVDQLKSSFPAVTANPVVKAGLPWAPLLLMKPEKRGSGAGAVVADPRVWSAAAIAGLAIASEVMKKVRNIISIRITRFERQIDAGSTHKFHADAFDDGGKAIPGQNITFSSDAPNVLEVDPTGVVKAVNQGTATITARMDGMMDLVTVKVN